VPSLIGPRIGFTRRSAVLALCRKPGEKVVIGNGITMTVVEVRGNRVRLAFDAPDQVRILRADSPAGRVNRLTPNWTADRVRLCLTNRFQIVCKRPGVARKLQDNPTTAKAV
jgi:hypothetical protein